ncbi:hypothetical protein M8818_001360 [Zalaria obscura]|uniref:Uncharacterized protein n=1 Tax=Zalaria obscura TaxID=2024903 RepID=A0ACC3SLU4_9PEZI
MRTKTARPSLGVWGFGNIAGHCGAAPSYLDTLAAFSAFLVQPIILAQYLDCFIPVPSPDPNLYRTRTGMQQQKGHLRQRHGSGALQLEQFDRDSREQSPYNNVEDDDQTYLHDPAMNTKNQYSPSTLEAGPQHPSSSSSSSNTNSNNAYLTPTSPQKELPEGATTPLNEDQTADGFPIQQYPPPSPTWGNMPAKPQLAILALSRFVDFFQMAALQTIMVHQLKSFDEGLPDSVISHQAGVLQGSFTAAQIITSVLWGRAADQPEVGRKLVLNIGLVGTGVTCIGLAFSKSYAQAVAWRVLGGAVNGTVGSARTMVAECVPKRYHPRAFLLLPAAFNFANMLGPILSGMLVDPVDGFPKLFGPGSAFGGADGVVWMREYPYALANLLSTVLLFLEAILVGIGCKETLKGHRQMQISELDPVRLVRSAVAKVRGIKEQGYRLVDARKGLLSGREEGSIELDRLEEDEGVPNEKGADRPPQRLAFHRLWTTNVLWTLLSIAIFDFHMGAFANLWTLFLSTSREFVPDSNPSNQPPQPQPVPRSAFKFSGGLAFPPPTIGFAMAIIGFIGIGLQFILYPFANAKFGLMRCFRSSLFLFPLAYFLAPYIALLPSSSPSPLPASGVAVWSGITVVLLLQVSARTFALPASIILLNNSSPHPSVLGSIHGIGQAASATFRTVGPMLAGYWYGIWLERGVVGMAWWIVAAVSAAGCVAAFKVRNGSGHEIFLPGEEGFEEQQMRREVGRS